MVPPMTLRDALTGAGWVMVDEGRDHWIMRDASGPPLAIPKRRRLVDVETMIDAWARAPRAVGAAVRAWLASPEALQHDDSGD